jgi:hypothetical protein
MLEEIYASAGLRNSGTWLLDHRDRGVESVSTQYSVFNVLVLVDDLPIAHEEPTLFPCILHLSKIPT